MLTMGGGDRLKAGCDGVRLTNTQGIFFIDKLPSYPAQYKRIPSSSHTYGLKTSISYQFSLIEKCEWLHLCLTQFPKICKLKTDVNDDTSFFK